MTRTPAPGRPRDVEVDAAILDSVRSRLGRDGYERMTIDDVARDAGVTRPTVYRRWASKKQLVAAAVGGLSSSDAPPPTGDVRADLFAISESLYARFEAGRHLGLLGAVLVERENHPELFEAYQDRVISPRRDSIRMVLKEGVRNGTLAKEVDIEVVVAAMVGSFYALSLADHWGEATDWAERITNASIRILGLKQALTQSDIKMEGTNHVRTE